MKLALARAGLFLSAAAALEAILIVSGIIRIGDTFVDTDDYVQTLLWPVIAAPILIGICSFFYTWNEELQEEKKRAREADKKD